MTEIFVNVKENEFLCEATALFSMFKDLTNYSIVKMSDNNSALIKGSFTMNDVEFEVMYLGGVGTDSEPAGFGKMSMRFLVEAKLIVMDIVGTFDCHFTSRGGWQWTLKKHDNVNFTLSTDGSIILSNNGLGFRIGRSKTRVLVSYSGTWIESYKKACTISDSKSVIEVKDFGNVCQEDKELSKNLKLVTQWLPNKRIQSMYGRNQVTKPWVKDGIERIHEDGVESTRFFVNGLEATSMKKPKLDCPVCYNSMAHPSAFVPCGHMTCNDCGPQLDKCPICREQKRGHLDLYLSSEVQDRPAKKIKLEP